MTSRVMEILRSPGVKRFIEQFVVPAGDVVREYLELLPLLAPGVLVHVHDIFTPPRLPGALRGGRSTAL